MKIKKIKFSSTLLGSKELSYVNKTFSSGWIISGKNEKLLEQKFCRKFRKKYCIFFNSWTSAAFALYQSLTLKKDDEIIMPSLSFVATANSAAYLNKNIIFADVDLNNFNLSIEDTLRKITNKTKYICIVDQLGTPFDIDTLKQKIKGKKIKIIHDAACSFGSLYKNRNIGLNSDFLLFSFQARKLITSGEGGALLTNNKQIYNFCNMFKNHGMNKNTFERSNSSPIKNEKYKFIGLNLRFNDIQSAILLSQVQKYRDFIKIRRKVASHYDKFFLKNKSFCDIQLQSSDSRSNRQSYMIILRDNNLRDKLIKYLYSLGIETRKAVTAIHKLDPYKRKKLSLPNSEKIFNNGIQLPMHAGLRISDAVYITNKIKYFIKKKIEH